MRGIVYDGSSAELTDELEVPTPGPGEVSVRISAAGLCHSDSSVIDGTIPWPAPAVLGHEGAGVIEEVGEGVRSLAPGDAVVLHTLASCGACAACAAGTPTRCRATLGNVLPRFRWRGRPCNDFAATSAFAEVTLVRETQAVPIDASVPATSACLIGCGVITGVGAVLNRARVEAGQSAVVFGVGGVGLNVIQGLRLAGAGPIVAVDTLAAKEAAALRFGATAFVAAGARCPESVRALLAEDAPTPADGADWAFECVGQPAALQQAIACLGWGGTCVAVGVPAADATLALRIADLAYVDRGVIGCRYGTAQPHRDFPMLVDLYREGRLELDALVTRTYPFERFDDAVRDLRAGELARGVLTF